MKAGSYVMEVGDSESRRLGVRTLDVEPLRKELARTTRDMHSLKQWAQLSRGIALRFEEISDWNELLEKVRQQSREAYHQRTARRPSGISWPVLLALLVPAGSEWLLRRIWQ